MNIEKRNKNENFFKWKPIEVEENQLFTPNIPIDWIHETPDNEELLEIAKLFPPPSEWFEENQEKPW